MGVGEFFGELGVAGNRRGAIRAAASLTCLVLSPAPPTKFAGRGEGARLASALPGAWANTPPASGNMRAGQGVISCDVSEQVMRKVEALSAYRSQFPLEPDMFPEFLLQAMFGREYFVASFPRSACSVGRDVVGGPCLTQRGRVATSSITGLVARRRPVAKDAQQDDAMPGLARRE